MFPFAAPAIIAPAGPAILRPQDVFQILTQPANAMQAAINALPFSPDLLIDKDRVAATNWSWRHAVTGLGNTLASNSGAVQAAFAGYSGTNNRLVYAYKQAANFIKILAFTHTNGIADTIDLSSLGVVGWVNIKGYDIAGSWYSWHRSLSAGNNLVLNTTAGQTATPGYITVSGTTLTFAAGADSGNYVLEAWAHNPDTVNGIIQCASVVMNGAGGGTATTGWPVQALVLKKLNGVSQWIMLDTARGFASGNDAALFASITNVESLSTNWADPASTGFVIPDGSFSGSDTIGFVAIRATT